MAQKQIRTRAVTANLSTEKAFAILELLAENKEPMRLLDIAQELQSSPSTVLRFLTTLQSCGYIRQDEDTMKYAMTFKICRVANKVSSGTSGREIAHPYLKQLSRIFGELACFAVEQDMSVVYIDVAEGPDQMLKSMQRIGNIAPLHCTGIGKLFLLNYSESEIDRLIRDKGLPRFTESTITDKETLLHALDIIREQGYAYDNEECEVGARCIAYPIRDYTGKIVAGLSVTGPVSRLTSEVIEKHRQQLQTIAETISQNMGYAEI